MDVPEIISVRSIAESRLFRIEELDLMFSNGEQRTYERLAGGRRSAGIVVALNDQDELLLITIEVLLATELYPATLEGDEPEPPELVTWPVDSIDELIASPEFCEARAIAALCLARPMLSYETGRKV